MFNHFVWKLFVGLCFALPFGLAGTLATQAHPTQQTTAAGECQDCHQIIREHWQASAHGQALSNTQFQNAWEAQGKPQSCLTCHTTGFAAATGTFEQEGVSCTACHNPAPADHPNEIMPTDVSSRMCGTCHLDTYAEWKTSTHGTENLACAKCHDPHSTSLKRETSQALCQACHKEEVHFFGATAHAEAGLLCTGCHLQISGSTLGEGHGQRTHTFTVDISTCGQCHEQAMHFPAIEALPTEKAEDTCEAPAEAGLVGATPDPLSPVGFAAVAALTGMAFGMILAPWLESWYRRLNSLDK